jgi:beta-galactosidase
MKNNPPRTFSQPLALLLSGLAFVLGAKCPASELVTRQTISLSSDWRFNAAEGTDDWARPGHDDSGWEQISVPHTWNNFDGQDGGSDHRRGHGWHRTDFRLPAEGKGATVTARFGPDGITICDPNRASEGADKVFQRIYERAI